MLSVQAIYQAPCKHLFFRESIWTRYLGLDASLLTLALCFGGALSILLLCIECTISLERKSRKSPVLLFLRTIFAIPTGILYLDAAFVQHLSGHRHGESAIATIGLYGLFKVWEICIAPLIDGASLPNWVIKPTTAREAVVGNGVAHQIPQECEKDSSTGPQDTKTREKVRLGYGVDLLSTLRGVSWLGDRHFDFLTRQVISEQSFASSRLQFVRERLRHVLFVCLCYDACDSITKSQRWMKAESLVQALPDGTTVIMSPQAPLYAQQITSRPLYQQAVFVLITAITTQLSLETFYTLLALLCVGVLNVSPKAFPHFFGNPISLQTDSVRSFWGARWHHIFRRVYDRAVDPWLYVMGISKRSTVGIVFKVTAVFTISGLVHCVIQARTLVYHFPPEITPPLLDQNTLWFFMSQPVALFFEHLVVRLLTRRLPSPLAYLTKRIWTWGWLFWSARWWTETWVKMGMWQPEEQVVFFSPIRGLWKGEWIVEVR